MRNLYIISFFMVINLMANAQMYRITFKGGGISNTVDSVSVENIDQGISLTLNGSDTLILSGFVRTQLAKPEKDSDINLYPNPANGKTLAEVGIMSDGNVMAGLYTITGQRLLQKSYNLKKGNCLFEISGLKTGVYIFNVTADKYTYTGKLIINNAQSNYPKITLVSNEPAFNKRNNNKNTQVQSMMEYHDGESLLIKCYAGVNIAVIPIVPVHDMEVFANFISCIDATGNSYSTVTVIDEEASGRSLNGTQVWMAQNLNVGIRMDGVNSQTNNEILEKYCFNNDETNCDIYGGLYLWEEAMQYTTVEGSQGMCPEGWHIPTQDEWCAYQEFLDYSASCATSWPGYDIGKKLRAHYGWDVGLGTNSSGFTALPGGVRSPTGDFPNYIGCAVWFWTGTEVYDSMAFARQIYCTMDGIDGSPYTKNHGFSVRCISDNTLPTVVTSDLINITPTGATSGGNVISDGGEYVTQRGICWSLEPSPDIADFYSIDESGTGSYVSILENLEINSLYYVRAYAINQLGVNYGNELRFVTNTSGPSMSTVTTNGTNSVTQHSAVVLATVHSDGNDPVIERGICWNTIQQPTISQNHVISGSGIGNYEALITGLDLYTSYHVRAYAINSIGVSYGEDIVFTTLPSDQPCGGQIEIMHDGVLYPLVEIGYQCWFQKNLDAGVMILHPQEQIDNGIIEKYCYDNDPANCELYGGLYQWNELMNYNSTESVQGICPEGFHVPTEADWATMADYLGGFENAATIMKSILGWADGCQGTNESGYNGKAGGVVYEGNFCCPEGSYNWTSTQFDSGLSKAHDYGCSAGLWPDTNYQTFSYSARCIKDY